MSAAARFGALALIIATAVCAALYAGESPGAPANPVAYASFLLVWACACAVAIGILRSMHARGDPMRPAGTVAVLLALAIAFTVTVPLAFVVYLAWMLALNGFITR